jgi:hypothetical protein
LSRNLFAEVHTVCLCQLFVIELLLCKFFFFSITELFGQAGGKILERVGNLELSADALSHYQSGPAQSENGERVSSFRERVC